MNKILLSILTFILFTTASIAGGTPVLDGPGDKNPVIKSFPNPVTTELTVEVQLVDDSFSKIEVKIVNLLGQEMVKPLKQDLNGLTTSFKIDLRDLPNGFYFMEVTSSSSTGKSYTYTKKITKH
jgi:hypothetical protein